MIRTCQAAAISRCKHSTHEPPVTAKTRSVFAVNGLIRQLRSVCRLIAKTRWKPVHPHWNGTATDTIFKLEVMRVHCGHAFAFRG